MKNIPNIITIIRIILSIVLPFLHPFGVPFYLVYLVTGFTDILDGFLARKLNAQSKMGSLLDGFADVVFIIAVSISIKDYFSITAIIFVCTVLLIKLSSALITYIKFHKPALYHTALNKFTGLSLFALVLFLDFEVSTIFVYIVGVTAILASIEELMISLLSRKFDSNILFFLES